MASVYCARGASTLPTSAPCCFSTGLVAAGLLLRTEVPGHAFLRADGVGLFFTALLQLLAWPGPAWLPWTVLPVAIFVTQRFRTRSLRRDDVLLLALFGWLFLQAVALAYARGGGPGVLRSRYLDILTVNVALGYLFLANLTPARWRPRFIFCWSLVTLAALATRGREHARDYFLPDLPHRRAQEANVAAYLRTGDASLLRAAPADDIPYPDAGALMDRLASPALRAVLPPSIRPPVALTSTPAATREVPPSLQSTRFAVVVSTWSHPAEGSRFTWRSADASASTLPILRFRVAGDLAPAHPDLQLQVRSPDGAVAIAPDAPAGERWKSVTVFRPAGAWWLEADDADPSGWFAVAAPVELTRGTWLAEKLIKFHFAVIGAGLACLLIGAVRLRAFSLGETARRFFRQTIAVRLSPFVVVGDDPASSPMSPLNGSDLELTILLPCLNEAETLGRCVEEAQRALREHEIHGEVLVADNGSRDGSPRIAARHGARVVHVAEKGYGRALQTGIAAARGRYVLMGDADGSYDFTHARHFLDRLREGWDLVMGNRFLGGIQPGAMPWKNRHIGNPLLSGLGRLFFPSRVRDFHCGLRAFSRPAIAALDLRTSGMEFASEMVIKATLHGLRVTEIPTTLRPDGRSRPPHLRPWRDGWRHLRFMLLFSPRWLFLHPGLALIALGTLAGALLLRGPLHLGAITLDVHTLFFAAMAVLIGFQSVAFAVCTKVYAIQAGLLPADDNFQRWFKRIDLEKGLVAGGALIVAGITLSLRAVGLWQAHDFGDVGTGALLRWVIPGGLLLTLGCQTVLVSFFLSILGLSLKKR